MIAKYQSPILGECTVSCEGQLNGEYRFRVHSKKHSAWIKLPSRSYNKAVTKAEEEFLNEKTN